jgi:hypothetical protein
MLDRLIGLCVGLLIAAVAVCVAVRLIESVAAALLVIAAVTGGGYFVALLGRALWRRHAGRW